MSTSRRAEVLAALRAAAGGTVSGEALAARLGVSRVAIAKHVRHLREAGYEIASVPGSGYRLVFAPDALAVDDVASRVTSPRVHRISGGDVTGSTNDDAKKLAKTDVPEITVVIASRQTAGRGRLGRAWESPEGGVYVSFVLRPPLPVHALTALPLAVGIGVAQGLERLGVDVGLKWPNDLVLAGSDVAGGDSADSVRSGGKLAGVLLEMAAEADRAQWVVVGMGVNVRRPSAGGEPAGAAYLDDTVPGVRLPDVAAAVVDGVAAAYERFLEGGFGALRAEYDHRHVLTGRHVSVAGAAGERIAEGRVEGVDDMGRLLMATPHGTAAVSAGDVTLRNP